ncbi:MAG: hypothetical protein HUJ53_08830 [Holdemanella sp.]|nr:hypothetical protein [Holdemanella sp.]
MKSYSEYEQLSKMREMVSPEQERLMMLREMVDSGVLPLSLACLRSGLTEIEFKEKTDK